ncbi:hypothetical protein ACFL7D_09760 [candidate division KSB1 bacterium]
MNNSDKNSKQLIGCSIEYKFLLLYNLYKLYRKLINAAFDGCMYFTAEQINILYIQIRDMIKIILNLEGFEDLSKKEWKPFDGFELIDGDYVDEDWEFSGRQLCDNFQHELTERFSKLNIDNNDLEKTDKELFERIDQRITQFISVKKEYEDAWLLRVKKEGREFNDRMEELSKKRDNILKEDKIFICRGEKWEIRYDGELCFVKDNDGMRYIAYLLSKPKEEVNVIDLMIAVKGSNVEKQKDLSELLNKDEYLEDDADIKIMSYLKVYYKNDNIALNEIYREIRKLKDKIAIFKDTDNKAECTKVEEELRDLLEHIKFNKILDPQQEKCRIAVRKAVKRAIDNIFNQSSALFTHLDQYLDTGTNCIYKQPEGSTNWFVSMINFPD